MPIIDRRSYYSYTYYLSTYQAMKVLMIFLNILGANRAISHSAWSRKINSLLAIALLGCGYLPVIIFNWI